MTTVMIEQSIRSEVSCDEFKRKYATFKEQWRREGKSGLDAINDFYRMVEDKKEYFLQLGMRIQYAIDDGANVQPIVERFGDLYYSLRRLAQGRTPVELLEQCNDNIKAARELGDRLSPEAQKKICEEGVDVVLPTDDGTCEVKRLPLKDVVNPKNNKLLERVLGRNHIRDADEQKARIAREIEAEAAKKKERAARRLKPDEVESVVWDNGGFKITIQGNTFTISLASAVKMAKDILRMAKRQKY